MMNYQIELPEYKKWLEKIWEKYKLDVEPFTQVVFTAFTPQELKELKYLGELAAYAEFESVVRDIRKVNVFHLDPFDVDNQLRKIINKGLVYYPIFRIKRFSGFAHKHTFAEEIDRDTVIYGVIAKNIEDAKKFDEASRKIPSDHTTIGKLLGYPECDIEFFNKYYHNPNYDLIPEIALNTKGVRVKEKIWDNGHSQIIIKVRGYPENNILFRYCGIRIIPHFPHSFDCKEAREFGKKFFELMKEKDERIANLFYKILSDRIVWDAWKGVVEVRHGWIFCVSNTYPFKNRITIIWENILND